MIVRLLIVPLFLTGALLIGCEDRTARSPDAATEAKAADAKSAADKAAADAKAKAEKTAANATADADKAAADAKTAAIKATADASKAQATKLLADLQTAVKGQKWTDAAPIIKQLDALRDKLAADQQASFDSLKKQYNDNKP